MQDNVIMTNSEHIHGWTTAVSSDRSTWKRIQQNWEGAKKGDQLLITGGDTQGTGGQ